MAAQTGLPEPAPAQFFARLPSYPWFVVATVCIGAFMGQLDASIVQLAMPALEDAFDAPLEAVSWVAVAYVLGFAVALPAFARLAEIAGRKTLYLCGFALFGMFSALCGLAPSLPLLIASGFVHGDADEVLIGLVPAPRLLAKPYVSADLESALGALQREIAGVGSTAS